MYTLKRKAVSVSQTPDGYTLTVNDDPIFRGLSREGIEAIVTRVCPDRLDSIIKQLSALLENT